MEFEVLTSAGPAAIAVIRVWGERCAAFITRHVRPRSTRPVEAWPAGAVLRAELVDTDGAALDDMLVSVHGPMPALDVRLHLHGNPWLVQRCTELLQACGLHSAAEERTTLWPTADVLEAEAWTLLPRMRTLTGAQWLLAQPGRLRTAVTALLDERDINSVRQSCAALVARAAIVDWFTRPLRVALVGPPNAGKSTLANALVDRPVSIVSPTPGTTRDWVEVAGETGGFPMTWLDTAGLRESTDALEQASINRAKQLMHEADGIVLVLDATEMTPLRKARFVLRCFSAQFVLNTLSLTAIALNKIDLAPPSADLLDLQRGRDELVPVSALQGRGLDALCALVLTRLGRNAMWLLAPAAFTRRQVKLLEKAATDPEEGALRGRLLQVIGGQ